MNCPKFNKGFATSEVTLGVILIFITVSVILYVSNPDYFMNYVSDLKLKVYLKRISNEINNLTLDGRIPSCAELVGFNESCAKTPIEDVAACKCPYFVVSGVATGIEPYPGIKFTTSSTVPGSFCLSAVANNPSEDGNLLRVDYPERTEVYRSFVECK